jgi:serine/threonine protein kinase
LEELSPDCRDLIMWMLEIDPGMRPTAKQALMHDWFTTEQEIIRELLHVNQTVCKQNLPLLNIIGEIPLTNSVVDTKGEAFNSFQMVSCYFRGDSSKQEINNRVLKSTNS